jgi:hypothetical protein
VSLGDVVFFRVAELTVVTPAPSCSPGGNQNSSAPADERASPGAFTSADLGSFSSSGFSGECGGSDAPQLSLSQTIEVFVFIPTVGPTGGGSHPVARGNPDLSRGNTDADTNGSVRVVENVSPTVAGTGSQQVARPARPAATPDAVFLPVSYTDPNATRPSVASDPPAQTVATTPGTGMIAGTALPALAGEMVVMLGAPPAEVADLPAWSNPVAPAPSVRRTEQTTETTEAQPVEANRPAGQPVAGPLERELADLGGAISGLLDSVADLAAADGGWGDTAWYASAVALACGAGYALWANRRVRPTLPALPTRPAGGTV